MAEDVTLPFTPDEALVLFEWLSRETKSDAGWNNQKLAFVHPSERVALWNLLAALESNLVEPFQANYNVLLDDARNRLTEH